MATQAYMSDHSPAVIRTHAWRTAQNSIAYLLPHLTPSMKILDVGCGPGSITIDLAELIPQGHITGIEYTSSPLPAARELAAQRRVSNVTFQEGDVQKLNFEDNTFDVVHAHQVLQHIADPIQGLKEMRRVCKPGGLVAVRESASMTCYPELAGLAKWRDLYYNIAKERGTNPHPGARIHVWARKAGFRGQDVKCSTGSWCFETREEREFWGGNFAERALKGAFHDHAVEGGHATEEDMREMSRVWREWVEDEEGWFGVLHGEILCTKRDS